MLSTDWSKRKTRYDFVVVGSGYGGSILAARLAGAPLNPKPSVCILERGKEWPVGSFPDKLAEVVANTRNALTNPLGLYEFLPFRDISVVKGSGLGGTSLINANVAIVPDEEVFQQVNWPARLKWAELQPYYEKAKKALGASPHPRAQELLKVKALDRRAREIGTQAFPLEIAVNFSIDGENPFGVAQKPCIDCGDCVTGCNVGAKNTLYMNYLPLAKRGGADIFTQTQVDYMEKLPGGGFKVHGRVFPALGFPKKFELEAANVILSAGSLGTAEILLRSELKGLSLSPRVGTSFNGNGDFFGLAYNSDHQTNVLGFGNHPDHLWRKKGNAPGPNIVGVIRYSRDQPLEKRIAVEDFSFPSAYVGASMAIFGAIGGEDTDVGDETTELGRQLRNNPLAPYQDHNAMNHTMLYLVMGHDDAKGMLHLATGIDPNGQIEIDWDDVGREPIFTQMNEEIRRHARALGGRFIENPLWGFVTLRNLITAHPLGGCPLGDDYLQGAVDEFGRVFAGDGSIQEGLFVADGSLIPSALGVNPFLTISALSERIADRLVRRLGGEAYPARAERVAVGGFDPLEVIHYKEADLERIFSRVVTKGMEVMLNSGGRSVDLEKGRIRNDTVWKGFFPRGHILNEVSTALFASFKKKFSKSGGQYLGVTSDADERINARNTLEEIDVQERTGTLEKGKYVLLRYSDPAWDPFYDIFKVINDDLLIGRVYLGEFPEGRRLFTFAMSRVYGLDNITVADHRALYDSSPVPTKGQLAGLWEMRAVANANNTGTVAYLKFDLKPDGRLESRYRFLGLLEGLVEPVFAQDHFQLNDFTPFHDEIRAASKDFLVGKYTTAPPPGLMELFGPNSLGIFHQETSVGGTPQFSFYYTLRRSEREELPPTGFLQPLLEMRLPDGVGMTFDEQMVGHYFPGFSVPAGGKGDLAIEAKVPRTGKPADGVDCSFQVRMTIRDLNEFLEAPEHEARLSGTIHFGDFGGKGPSSFDLDAQKSYFNYLRVNPETQEAEMQYRLYFSGPDGKEYLLLGRKYMQKDLRGGIAGAQEILHDYTTLYSHLIETASGKELGCAWLKFRTVEDVESVGSLLAFLRSFQVTGSKNPFLQAQAQLRFLAFTNHSIMREYDPLTVLGGMTEDEVREAVLRGAEIPDYFSSRPTVELHTIFRERPALPLEALLNKGTVRIDYGKRRIYRDSFWKGSFARDTLLGWEERVRSAGAGVAAEETVARYVGGSFWKRFDRIVDDRAEGHVVNYEVDFLPGKPLVRRVKYPDNNRKYCKAGDDVLLLNYANEPYRVVHDTIKVIDEDSAIGIMHLGDFPNGVEFATFVMERHNYPFEKMSVADHHAIFGGDRVRVPGGSEIAGEWEGHLIFLTRPDISLMNQLNPVAFRLRFLPTASGVEGRYRFGLLAGEMKVELTDEFVRLADFTALHDEIRMIDEETLIGKWVAPPSARWLAHPELKRKLQGYLEPGQDRFGFYYLLKRV